MHIRLSRTMLNKLTDQELELFGWERSYVRSEAHISVPLRGETDEKIEAYRRVLVRLRDLPTRHVKPILDDIDRWLGIVEHGGAGAARPRTLQQFSDMLTEYVRTSPGRRLYLQDQGTGEWLPYYVNFIEYVHEQRNYRDRYDFTPAHVLIHMMYWELGKEHRRGIELQNKHIDGRTVRRALAEHGLVIESPDLRAQYMQSKRRFDEVFGRIGRQYLCRGLGIPMDTKGYFSQNLPMMREGSPGKVVIDVLEHESDEREVREKAYVRPHFWSQQKPTADKTLDSDDLAANRKLAGQTLPDEDIVQPEIPLRPTVAIYHLGRHRRFKVNVLNLDDYEFDKSMGDQLILPPITKNLVNVLVSQGRLEFSDIVQGKGTGACILLGGPPGVGKTLTAEVFAEATERPLLSVHAAQLGTNGQDVEHNLREVLDKGSRWNAVVLLDEADVYIRERGHDLHQNAIVAAFLRVLENHTATIFMTTNRMDDVDDAVISRCLARIDYRMPSIDSQRAIWQVLTRLNSISLASPGLSHDRAIDRILEHYGNLSGRDIKQLLKLAALWCDGRNEGLSFETIGFVRQFLPTRELPDMDQE